MVSNPNVSISKVTNSIPDAVRQVVDLLGGMRRFVKKGDRVIVKPNLAYPYPPPATTDPRVVEAVATLCAEAGAGAVWIGDSSSYSCKDILGAGKWNNRDVIEQTGMDNTEVEDHPSDRLSSVSLPGGSKMSVTGDCLSI